MILPSSVEVLGERCFSHCGSLSSITFESGSRLSRIEKWTFSQTGLIDIVIPSSVEVLREVGKDAFVGVPVNPTLPTKKCCIW
jgi:hypothetical protein